MKYAHPKPLIYSLTPSELETALTEVNYPRFRTKQIFEGLYKQRISSWSELTTLPGMTASTVIYHQALAKTPPLRPLEFIEQIIDTAQNRHVVLRS